MRGCFGSQTIEEERVDVRTRHKLFPQRFAITFEMLITVARLAFTRKRVLMK